MARDTNFYYSFLVLPADQRRAIVAVWDVCRAIDDAVDEVPAADTQATARAVECWRAEVTRIFDGSTPETPQGRAVQPFVRRFDLPRPPFDALIDGVAMDVGDRRYANFDELRLYCYRVASTVGLICVAIFGCRSDAARQYAEHLGIALQLTNILRDVPVDLSRGRLYLPLDELARFGCTEDDLREKRVTDRVRALLQFQGARAREFYASARRLLPRDERRRLVAAEIMGAIYRAILTRIERRDYDVFTELVRVPRPRRAVIAAATWVRVLAGLP
jgi:phytoene synthase